MNYVKSIEEIAESLDNIIIAASDEVWGYSELYFQEFKSSAALANYAKEGGFSVEMGVCNMPTAFIAKWGKEGPKIGILAEYDALPGLNQQAATPHKVPMESKSQNDPGHGCGHNCLGAGSLGAALALKQWCEQTGNKAQIYYFGCPAEENGSGKMFMARDGAYADMDICITWHPSRINEIVGSSSLACLSAKFTFHGVTSHAAGSPHLGRSALDACELMNVGVNYLREHIIPEARVHYSYLDVGGKAPNVVQDIATTFYFIRAPKVKQALEIAERVYEVARGAGIMTGTTLEIEKLDGLCDYIPNKVLAEGSQEIFEQLGAPTWSESDFALAKEFAQTVSKEDFENAKEQLVKAHKATLADYDNIYIDHLVAPYNHQPAYASPGSTDVGDVSYCAPTVQVHVATGSIGTPGHSWQMTSQSCSPLAHKGTVKAAAIMAAIGAKAILEPEFLAKAKAEHKENAPNGYICPSPAELMPTIC